MQFKVGDKVRRLPSPLPLDLKVRWSSYSDGIYSPMYFELVERQEPLRKIHYRLSFDLHSPGGPCA